MHWQSRGADGLAGSLNEAWWEGGLRDCFLEALSKVAWTSAIQCGHEPLEIEIEDFTPERFPVNKQFTPYVSVIIETKIQTFCGRAVISKQSSEYFGLCVPGVRFLDTVYDLG